MTNNIEDFLIFYFLSLVHSNQKHQQSHLAVKTIEEPSFFIHDSHG